MNPYGDIIDPSTGKYISIDTKLGHHLLANYLEVYQYGGLSKPSIVEKNTVVEEVTNDIDVKKR